MIGWSGALNVVAGFLEANLETKIAELRERLGDEGPLTKAQLPSPQLFTTEERAGRLPFQDFPAILVVGRQLRSNQLLETQVAGDVYLRGYVLRVYFWVRSPKGFAEVTIQRNRYSLALTELLLGRPSLAQDAGGIDVGTLVEVPGESDTDDARRTIAGSYLEFQVTIEETVARAALGPVTGVRAEPVRPHPELP